MSAPVNGGAPGALPARAFWFLRHGETDWNAANLSQGRTDIPLNDRGLAQAAAAATLMRGRGIASIVSSPMDRARETARLVGEALSLPVAVETELQEVCFGEQEGQPMGDWYDGWIDGSYTPRGAESFAELCARTMGALGRALEHPAPVLVVAHGALFRAVRAAMGLPINVRTPNALPLFCEPGEPWTLTAVTDHPLARPS